MKIPKQDIIDGLPIRWAFHVWVTGGQWKFNEWREYLLSWDTRGYELLIHYLKSKPQYLSEIKRVLKCNDASTLAGFIRYWYRCCEEYERLLKEYYPDGIK